jgi:predicted enzyme related to lactoylglutathione lyase
MAVVQSVIFNILTKHFAESVAFYRAAFELETISEADWRVVLSPPGQPDVQIGIMSEVSEFTPRQAWGMPAASILTLVVEDIYDVLDRALGLGASLVDEPAEMAYGMTRAIIRDPTGFVIDLSSPTISLADRTGQRDSLQQPIGRGFDPAGQE